MADLVPAASSLQVISGSAQNRTYGATIAPGTVVRRVAGKMQVADCNVDEATAEIEGITVDAGVDEGLGRVALNGAVIDLGCDLVVGGWYVLSDDAGGIKPIEDQDSGDWVGVVGYARAVREFVVHIVNTGVQHD